MIKVTKDNFVWCIVTDKAHRLFTFMELFELHEDDSESLIETHKELLEAIGRGNQIAIEGGQIVIRTEVEIW
jgi:DNA-binding GntR family transcriptional regulator